MLSDKGLTVCFAILLCIVEICYFFLTLYKPNALLYLTTMIVVAMLVVASWKVKADYVTTRNVESIVRPIWFGAVGIAFGFLFFFIMYAVPHLVPFPIIPILLEGLLCLLVLLFVVKYSGHTKNFSHELAFTSGLLSPLIFLAFIHEINGIYGMSIVGIFFIVLLIYLGKRIGYYQRRMEELKTSSIDFE